MRNAQEPQRDAGVPAALQGFGADLASVLPAQSDAFRMLEWRFRRALRALRRAGAQHEPEACARALGRDNAGSQTPGALHDT